MKDREPIAELFGDVIADGPALLYPPPGAEPPIPARDVPVQDIGARDTPGRDLGAQTTGAQTTASRNAPDAAHPLPAEPAPPLGEAPIAGTPPSPLGIPADSAAHRAAGPVWCDDRGLLSGVVISHGLITALTFGLGRFWLKSEQRALLWSHTELEREPLEWTGTGAEMFAGAMAALLAVAATFGLVHLSVAFAGATLIDDADLAPLARSAVIAAVAIPPLWAYAGFRARRYRLSRSRWKGVHFGMDGSGLGLVGLWLLWAPVLAITAGLAWPFWRWAREGHLTRRARWGGARFRFEGSPWPLALHWAPLWLIGAAAVWLTLSPAARAALGPLAPEVILARGMVATAAACVAVTLAIWFAWINWRAAETREFWRARRLLEARATCDFSVWHMIDASMQVSKRNFWPGIGVYLAIAAAAAVPAASAFHAERSDPTAGGLLWSMSGDWAALEAIVFENFRTWRAQGLLLMSAMINYVLSLVFVMWLWSAIYAGRLHRNLVESLRFTGLESLDAVVQHAREAEAEAEGLADASGLAPDSDGAPIPMAHEAAARRPAASAPPPRPVLTSRSWQ